MREGRKRDRDVGQQGGRKGEEEGRERGMDVGQGGRMREEEGRKQGMDAWEEECGAGRRYQVG
jgi:hypothetical protein